MSPHHIDPDIDYLRLRQLSVEFTAVWERLQALYLDAAAGFALLREHVERDQTQLRAIVQGTELDSDQFRDTRLFSYEQIFSGDFCTSSIHRATQGEVKSRNSPNGTNFAIMGQICLVSFYDFWNDYLRREYVVAKGKLKPTENRETVINEALQNYASYDLWGDIRHLRTSIVHNQGIATSDVTRCQLIKWFQPGDEIALTPNHMRALFLALLRYRNELFKEQFAEHYIQVPSTKK